MKATHASIIVGSALAIPILFSANVVAQKQKPKSQTAIAQFNYSAPHLSGGKPAAFTGQPDARLVVQRMRNGAYFASVDSKSTAYSRSGSPYFVVDIEVPAKFNPGFCNFVRLYAKSTAGGNASTCANTTLDCAIYKRGARSPTGSYLYTWVEGGSKDGNWHEPEMGLPAFCDSVTTHMVAVPISQKNRNAPSSVYRVMARPKLNDAVVPATIGWHWGP